MWGLEGRRGKAGPGLFLGLVTLALLVRVPGSAWAGRRGPDSGRPLEKPRCCFRLRVDGEGFYRIDYGDDRTRQKIGIYVVLREWHTYSIVSFHDSATQYSSLVAQDVAEAGYFSEDHEVQKRTSSGAFVAEDAGCGADHATGKGPGQEVGRLVKVGTERGGTGFMSIRGRTAVGGNPDFYGWRATCGEASFASAVHLRGPFWDFDIPAPPLDALRTGTPNGLRTTCSQFQKLTMNGVGYQDYYAVEAKLTYIPETELAATKKWLSRLIGDAPGYLKDFPYQHAVLEDPPKSRCRPVTA